MVFGFCSLIIIFILWKLLLEGLLWKIILGIGGWFGISMLLLKYFPNSIHDCFTFYGHNFSWAETIPTIIVLMAAAHTKED